MFIVVSFATNHTEMRIAGNSLSEIREFFENELVDIYDKNEIRALYRQAAQEINGYSMLHLHFHPDDTVQESELIKYSSWVKRLKFHEPVQYITGKSWFMDLEIHVNPAVLIPRPETEEIVNHLLMNLGDRKLRILDACTGSGCIALALKHYLPDSEILAFDVSETALTVAISNAQRLGLNINFQLADLQSSPLEYQYSEIDVLISNPPYIPNNERESLAKHVSEMEPSIALFVPDEDPLLFYKRLADWAKLILKNDGKLIAECHTNYTGAVADLWRNSGLFDVEEHVDLSNLPRFVTAVIKK
jgi:release factor glutamine methyltransferase